MKYDKIINTLLEQQASKAVQYLSDKQIIRATRKRYKNGKDYKTILRNTNIEITLTIGKPNFIEREFIKKCKKINEPFPVKKIQLKF